ncbi:helicase-like transcription factor CHR28 isoform X2 [Asparagus officinalis]|uniref:helicase-like transcription factor CHR28 isoform X2 n=1 Tax=Asparagus officinalis TaxID=4686 RepID=UPI00098DFC33|nr:helicase-like transcription factor CHR28 isoform X2 [Asparagus officinalis]
MDIIEIDSAESEDDIDRAWSDCEDQNHDLEMNFQNYPRLNNNDNSAYPESSTSSKKWAEIPVMNLGNTNRSNGIGGTSHVAYETPSGPQLNGYHESFNSKPSEHSSRARGGTAHSQQKEPNRAPSSGSPVVDLSNTDNYSRKFDNKSFQNAQKRTLPPSLQPTVHNNASEGPVDYKGRKNMSNEFEADDKRKASSSMSDEVQIYRSVGTHRVLPPSLMNGKSVDNSMLVGSSDPIYRSGPSGLGEQRLMEHDERAIYQEALQNLGQPKLEDDLPEGLLSVSLLKHQKIALGWMVQKEKSVHCTGGILADDQGLGKTISMIALIQKQRTLQSNFMSNDSHQTKPEALNLDDDDDDGPTELNKEKQPVEDDPRKKQVASSSVHTAANPRPAAGTLVVCPASVLRQWSREIDEKVTSSAKLSVLIYHGGSRTRDPSELAKYDVVLTTYAIVTNEVPKQSANADDDGEQKNLDKYEISSEFSSTKRKEPSNVRNKGKKKSKKNKDSHFDYDSGPLARVRWYRVILDEAQTIKNHRTQVARACSGLRAKRRWCLSGTPIQNSIDDLYSYFRFLKYDPYYVYSAFCSSIKYPISKNATHGYKKLQAVLKAVLLRRTKGTLINGEPIINIPPKSIKLKKVDFSPAERSFYLQLEADSRQQFKKFAAAGTVKQNYASILLMLLRLRQACDHPILVKGYHSDNAGKGSLDVAKKLPKNVLLNLLRQLESSLAICRVCNDPPEDAVVTICGHVFCYQCVSEHLTGDDNFCPAAGCKETLSPESAFSQATLQSCISEQLDNNTSSSGLMLKEEPSIVERGYVSSKIKAALEILNSLCSPSYYEENLFMADTGANRETPVKAIVFSQWTSMLDLLEDSLNQSLIQYRRLDGSVSLPARDRAVKEFNTDPEVTVMLMSLKAGNLGLNMVAACHVILLDLWWNPTTEDQAVDRAHRIGQTRPVTVSRLTVKDTVEDRILALQEGDIEGDSDMDGRICH